MTQLLNSLQTILGAGIGGVSFFTAWIYLVTRWLQNANIDVIPFIPFI